MKSVLRRVYYCDFCKKRGGSPFHMKRHEAGCTLNPERYCSMCAAMGLAQTPVSVLVAIVPRWPFPGLTLTDVEVSADNASVTEERADQEASYRLARYEEGVRRALFLLREGANCPACILAALRQSGTREANAALAIKGKGLFDFAKERDAMWARLNAERAEDER